MELEKGSTSDRKGQRPPQIEFICAKIKFICKIPSLAARSFSSEF